VRHTFHVSNRHAARSNRHGCKLTYSLFIRHSICVSWICVVFRFCKGGRLAFGPSTRTVVCENLAASS
jgi:hypothetical protein